MLDDELMIKWARIKVGDEYVLGIYGALLDIIQTIYKVIVGYPYCAHAFYFYN